LSFEPLTRGDKTAPTILDTLFLSTSIDRSALAGRDFCRRIRSPSDVNERQTLSRREAADRIGVHLTTLDARIADGSIKVVRLGRRVLIPATEIERVLDGAA
jgi:excisionase family DNA binding protein